MEEKKWEALEEQIENWQEQEEHQKIIDVLESIPQEEWDYELIMLLAEAYSDLACVKGEQAVKAGEPLALEALFEKALELLLTVEEEGYDDTGWRFEIGFALFQLDRMEEAMVHFRRAVELDPGDFVSSDFLRQCERALEKASDRNMEENVGQDRKSVV